MDAWKSLSSIAPGLTFWRIMGNTLFITVLAMFAEMFSAAIVAYGFARFRFKGRDVIFFHHAGHDDDSRHADARTHAF